MSDRPPEDASMTESQPTFVICHTPPPAIQLFNQVCLKREEFMELLEATRQLSQRLAAVSAHSAPKVESGLTTKVELEVERQVLLETQRSF